MTVLSSNDLSFNQKTVYNLSLKAFNNNVVMAQLSLAQAILESNLDGTPSLLALKYNNLFGIKGNGTKGTINLMTTEYINGQAQKVQQGFAWNNSIEDSIAQRKSLLENGTISYPTRYLPVLKATTFEQAANALVAGGYATDPSYATELIEIFNDDIDGQY